MRKLVFVHYAVASLCFEIPRLPATGAGGSTRPGAEKPVEQQLPLGANGVSIGPDAQASLNRSIGDWIERLPGVSLNGQGALLQAYSVRDFSRWRLRIISLPVSHDYESNTLGGLFYVSTDHHIKVLGSGNDGKADRTAPMSHRRSSPRECPLASARQGTID